MAALRRRIEFLGQLHDAYITLVTTFKRLQLRFVDFRSSQLQRAATDGEQEAFYQEFGKFPSVSNFVARLCNNLLRTTELYLNSQSNLRNPQNNSEFQGIKTKFEFLCQQAISCTDKVTFHNRLLDNSNQSTALQKLRVFQNIEGTQDLCSALGDVLRTVLLQEGSCSIKEFRKYNSELTSFTNPQ
jgi:hypothetical protein